MSKEDLIRGLNENLAAEWGTVMRYTYQAGKSFGLTGVEFREMLAEEVQDELGHASIKGKVDRSGVAHGSLHRTN